MSKRVRFYVETDVVKRIEALAQREGVHKNEVVRRVLQCTNKIQLKDDGSQRAEHQELRVTLDAETAQRLQAAAGGLKRYGEVLAAALAAYEQTSSIAPAAAHNEHLTPEQLALLRGKIMALRKDAIETLRKDRDSIVGNR